MRKHLYLIVEHEDPDHVGRISIYDSRFTQSRKGDREAITVLDEDAEDFRTVGKKVYLGYHDFDDADDYEERIDDVIAEKIGEVDRSHVEQAGLDPAEVAA